jgi:lipoprotein LpqH
VKRELTVAVVGAAILAAGISGCSSNKSTTSSSTSAGGGGGGGPTVLIDGKNQNVSGSVVCSTTGGTVNIAIGAAATGIGAVLTDASPPEVKSVGLGNVNGVTLAFAPGGGGNASATKNGNSYQIKGTATGIDMANPMQPVNKSFEIDVTCS